MRLAAKSDARRMVVAWLTLAIVLLLLASIQCVTAQTTTSDCGDETDSQICDFRDDCYWGWGSTCMTLTCIHRNYQSTCLSDPTCAWDSGAWACYDPGSTSSAPPCSWLYVQKGCNQRWDCVWSTAMSWCDSLYSSAPSTPGPSSSSSSSPSPFTFSPPGSTFSPPDSTFSPPTVPTTSSPFGSPTTTSPWDTTPAPFPTTPAPQDSPSTFAPFEIPTESPVTTSAVNTPRPASTQSPPTTSPTTTPQPVSTPTPPAPTSTSANCDELGQNLCVANENCEWGDSTCRKKPCGSRTTSTLCNAWNNCQWITSSNSCQLGPCSALTAASECNARSATCEWLSASSSCATKASATPAPTPVPTQAASFACRNFDSTTCNAQSSCTYEGLLCVNRNCGQFNNGSQCANNNCAWNASTTACTRLNQCPSLTTQMQCESVSGCAWSTQNSRCAVPAVTCESISTATTCANNGACSWNEQASPRCFTTPTSTAVCPSQTTSGNCIARGCEWISNTCYVPGSGAACTLAASESVCWDTSGCFWNASSFDCFAIRNLGAAPAGVAAVRTAPLTPTPLTSFTANFYGNQLNLGDGFAFIIAGTSCNNTLAFTPMSFQDTATFSVQAQSAGLNFGPYQCCYRRQGTTAPRIVDGYFLSVRRVPPTVTALVTDPSPPYHLTTFTFTLTGTNFNADDGFYFSSTTTCPTQSSEVYSSVRTVSSNLRTATGGYALATGTYILCYTNGIDAPFPGPRLTIADVAPWLRPASLADAGSKLTIAGVTVNAFNENGCDGATHNVLPSEYPAGPFLSPTDYSLIYGDGVVAHPRSDRCAFYIKPLLTAEEESMGTVIFEALTLNFDYVGFDDESDLRVFLPSAAFQNVMYSCDAFTTEAECEAQFCVWSPSSSSCGVGINAALDGCPGEADIPGFHLVRSLNYERLVAGTTKIQSLRAAGIVLVTCTGASTPSSSGFALSYSSSTSFCPSNCADKLGTRTGTCVNEGDGYRCQCSSGWTGADCQVRATCSGSRASATAITGAFGSYSVVPQGRTDTCGFLFTANPDGSTLQRMAKYTIGIEISNVTLTGNCTISSITVREGSYDGSVLGKLCREDVVSLTSRFRFLATRSASVYVHFELANEDSFAINYTAVSQVCPGPQGPSGVPSAADECDGRGSCVAVDFARQATLTQYAFECLCRNPFAPSAPFQSCTACGFGYREDSFPNCTDLQVCTTSADCKNGGTCEQSSATGLSTCKCTDSWYGVNCEFVNTNQSVVKRDFMTLRLTLDGFAANELSAGRSDNTMLPCQMPGSRFPCKPVERTRGQLYMQYDLSTIEDLSRRFRAQQDQQTGEPKYADLGLYFNKVVINNKYRDLVRISRVRATPLDVSERFAVTAWVRVNSATNGFLIAKIDSAFFADGTTPILNRALNDATDRYISDDALLTGDDDLAVHWGIYFDGRNRRVTVIQTRGKKTSAREDWIAVRHFRLGDSADVLFDGTWRHFVYQFGYSKSNTRFEGQVHIDGRSVPSSPDFVQCFTWPPIKLEAGAPRRNHSVPGTELTDSDGSMLIGYSFTGMVDELRVYDKTSLSTYDVVSMGGEIFNGELEVPTTTLVAMAIFGIVAVVASLVICVWRVRTERAAARAAEALALQSQQDGQEMHNAADGHSPNGNKYAALTPNGDEASAHTTPVQRPEVKSAWVAADEVSPTRAANGDVLVSDLSSPAPAAATDNSDPSRPSLITEVSCAVHDMHDAFEDAMHDANNNAKQDEKTAAIATVADAVDMAAQAVRGANGQASHTGDVKVSIDVKFDADPGVVLREIGNVLSASQEYLLRTTLVRDCWQMLSLFFVGFKWPDQFVSWWGTLTQAISFEFSINFAVPFSATYYVIMGLATFFFVSVLIIFALDKKRERDELIAEQTHVLEEKKKDENYSPPMTLKDVLTFACVFGVSGLYLPVTRNAVVVIFCHTSVQCVFDCYADDAHWLALQFGIASAIIITIGAPVAFFLIIRQKKQEFLRFIEGTEVDPAEAWVWFVRADSSPYRAIYSGFELRWCFFQVILMLVKAAMALITLGIEPNSIEQLLSIMIIQGLLTLSIFYSAPFLLDICDWIMQVSQIFVMIALVVSCIYRAFPEFDSYGEVLTSSAALNLLIQLILIIKHAKSSMVAAATG